MTQIESEAVMPQGVPNAYFFQIFNATSWSLILGTPMLLYLKGLGASATILGLTVAMLPLFSVLQIPAANYVERVGYKNFVVRGWASRSIFILGIAAAALLPVAFSPRFRIALIMLMLACFAAARGISICGYLPWLTQLVPEPLRGRYVSRDTMCMYIAITGTMLLSSAWVGLFPSARLYGILFLFSYAAALASLVFLRRIPDVQTVKPARNTVHPPWKEMLLFPPFFRYMVFNVVLNLFVAAIGVIWVLYMRDGYQASGSLILALSAYASILAAGASFITGPLADRFGSRPLLGFASGLIIFGQSLWMASAAGAFPRHLAVLFVIVSFSAIGFAILGVANIRLLMGLIPVMGRSHFFAISSVATSLTLGVLPVLWGLAFDTLSRFIPDGIALTPYWAWNRYSLIYSIIVAGLLAAQFLRHRLDEPRSVSTEEFMRILFFQSPARLANRVLSPLRRLLPPG